MCAAMAGVGLVAAAAVTQRELSREHTETKTGIVEEKKSPVEDGEGQVDSGAPATREGEGIK